MNPDVLERILRCPTLPSLPMVAMRVLELTQDENVSVDELARTIQNDQAIAAKVLKTVNSSFYGLRKPCATIAQAMVMLGLAAVKSLALSFSLVSSLGSSDDEFDHVAYWRRGLYTGVAAKLIAHEAGKEFEDEAFLGGLLQDIGMMAMYQGLGQAYLRVTLAAGHHRELVKHELASLEIQHPDIGAMLAERWKLPRNLMMPVKYHERPTATPPEYAPLVRCVSLGNFVHDILTDADPTETMREFQARANRWFNFTPVTCEALLKKAAEGAREVSNLFKLDTGAMADADQIIDKAQEHLAQLNEQSFREATANRPEMETVLADSDQFDPLTGVLAGPAGIAVAESEFESARKAGRPFTVLKVDVDNFTALVGSLGIEAGDAVLFETGSLLQLQFESKGGQVARATESVFDVIIAGLDRVGAVRAAAELREQLFRQSAAWRIGGPRAQALTASVGVATMEPAVQAQFARVQQLFTAGERALEAAHKGGGNCIRAFVPKAA